MWRKCSAELFSLSPDIRETTEKNGGLGLGSIRGRIAVVVFLERNAETIRGLSLRKADSRERKQYEKAIQDELETS